MKKFILSKVDHSDSACPPPLEDIGLDPSPPTTESPPSTSENGTIQPPLPVDPPPPSISPLKSPKKEIIEEESQNENADEYVPPPTIPPEEMVKSIKKEKETICRDFVRYKCTREHCRYAHVYRFCHNFQNKRCTLPKCKYVHGTLAEETVYLNTGYLPPHALAHIKVTPPPPGDNKQEVPSPASNVIPNPPPPVTNSNGQLPVITCIPEANTGNTNDIVPNRTWNADTDNWEDSIQIKCENCVEKEKRLNYYKKKAQDIEKNRELADKMKILEEKEERLNILKSVLMLSRQAALPQAQVEYSVTMSLVPV